MAVIGRVREIDAMRSHDNAAPEQAGPTTVSSHRPSATNFSRAPPMFYQAPQRDFFHETATRPDYSRPGLPRSMAEYGGPHTGQRPYVSKFKVPPRYWSVTDRHVVNWAIIAANYTQQL